MTKPNQAAIDAGFICTEDPVDTIERIEKSIEQEEEK